MGEKMLRGALATEADAVTQLINAAFQVERFALDGDRTNVEQVRGWFKTGTFLVLCEGDELLGCVYVEPRGDRAYLGLLSVEPARQGQGIGSHLMSAAEDHGVALGCRFADLRIVSVREGLPQFYRRLGYVESGMTPLPDSIPAKVPFHFIHMMKQLNSNPSITTA